MSVVTIQLNIKNGGRILISVPTDLDYDALLFFISELKEVKGSYGNLKIEPLGNRNKYIFILSNIWFIIEFG